MDISEYLVTSELLDCAGRTTHRLTLQFDGTVEVAMGQVVAVVDPRTRAVLKPMGVRLPAQVLLHIRERLGGIEDVDPCLQALDVIEGLDELLRREVDEGGALRVDQGRRAELGALGVGEGDGVEAEALQEAR